MWNPKHWNDIMIIQNEAKLHDVSTIDWNLPTNRILRWLNRKWKEVHSAFRIRSEVQGSEDWRTIKFDQIFICLHDLSSFSKFLKRWNVLLNALRQRDAAPRCSQLQGDIQGAKFLNLSRLQNPLEDLHRFIAYVDLHMNWKALSLWQMVRDIFEGPFGSMLGPDADMICLERRSIAWGTAGPKFVAELRSIGSHRSEGHLGFAVI